PPHARGVQTQADHHRWVKRGRPPGFILIRRIETAQIQLRHQIEQEEDHIALRQLGVRTLRFLSVALGLPEPIRFPLGLAHHRSPCVLRDKRRPHREDALSPVICPTATIDDSTGAFSDRLLEALDTIPYLNARKQGDFDGAIGGNTYRFDPDGFFERNFHSKSEYAHVLSGWQNARYDQLVEEAKRTLDPARRKELYTAAWN